MKSLAHPAHPVPEEIKSRVLRGIALHEEKADQIDAQGRGVYRVGNYRVDLAVFEGEESCSCPDHTRHPELSCKHLVMATLHRAKTKALARAKFRVHKYSTEAVEANLARLSAWGDRHGAGIRRPHSLIYE